MKRFLVTLIVIILAVSVGFGVFYLVRDNEVISLKTVSLYKDSGENFEVSLDMENPNSYTTVEVSSSDETVVKVEDSTINRKKGLATGTFKALKGGNARITFKTNNAKFRNITCDVVVCDGSVAFPFRIDTAQELQAIGSNEVYSADKSYTLNDNIDLGTLDEAFKPLPALTGVFDGAGYTISNLVVRDSAFTRVGLFQEVGKTGVVKNVKFEGAVLESNGQTTSMGVVAAENKGTIKLIEVMSAEIINANENTYVGGIAGINKSINTRTERQVARIDRTSVAVKFGTSEAETKGVIGGIAGQNLGGIIINSYSKGSVGALSTTDFGGIAGQNKYLVISGEGTGYNGNLGANIKDCYSIINSESMTSENAGAIIGTNTDTSNAANKIVGNYYVINEESGVKGLKGSLDYQYGTTKVQKGTTGITASELKSSISSLVSYSYYEKKIVVSGGKAEIVEDDSKEPRTYTWSLNVWIIDNTVNDGYPTLTFVDEYVDDNFDNTAVGDLITTASQVREIANDLSGTYFINANIDLSGAEWTPIGTKAQPFEGSVYVLDGYKITGLTITANSHTYAGFFGVLGSSAYVENMIIENSTITSNCEYVGAIAGQNNGTIRGAKVINGELYGTKYVGGIVGENINDASLIDVEVKGETLTSIKVSSSNSTNAAGGFAGFNGASIIASNITNTVSGKVKITSDGNVGLGGAVGHNAGGISNVRVEISRDTNYGVITSAASTIGGIAGYSDGKAGKITKAYVSATLSASDDSESSSVGGIVGSLNAGSAMAITQCVVENSYISGNRVGGIAANVTTSYTYQLSLSQSNGDFDGNVYISNTIDYVNDVTIREVAVESNVTLAGGTTGGFIAFMTQGMLADGYTKAKLAGSNNAGIVYSIGYNKSSKEGGVIFDVYSAAITSGGTSYAVSSSEVHNSWKLISFIGQDVDERSVGVIFDYYYVSRDNMKDPKTPAPFKSKNQGRAESTLKQAGTWSFLDSTVWNISEGNYPSVKSCEIVKEL